MRQIPRLFVDHPLSDGISLTLDGDQAHYLANVLRLGPGAEVVLLDDRTGEWSATIEATAKRHVTLKVMQRLRPRETVPDLWLLAAPIRRQRFEWVVEKATELGVARIVPILTARTQGERVNPDRLHAHMVEAAEQCGRTALPELAEAIPLLRLLDDWQPQRTLLFADEAGGEPMHRLEVPAPPAALLIGPEGGFSDDERGHILGVWNVRRLSLGPRILRADTAAVAAVTLWQAVCGDA